jgi:ketosteroid isomerase-like protein
VSEREDFHRDFLPLFIEAQRAFHDGNPEPNIALWSTRDPVTLFAVRGMRESGTEALNATFRRVAAWFSNLTEYEWVPVASGVSGDMAYTVCLERYTATVFGGPDTTQYRSTHVFRREDGRWRAIHRHADRQPTE